MKKGILFILSIGWLVPAWIAILSIDSWFMTELIPMIYGDTPMNSFPYHQFIKQSFTIAGVWFTLVFVLWSAYLIFRKVQVTN